MSAKKWIPIVVGVVIFMFLVGAGLVGGLVYVVTRNVKAEKMSATVGQEDFERLVAKMADQTPLIELPAEDSDAAPKIHRELLTKEPGAISTLHLRVWLPRERKMVSVNLPIWMVRMMGRGPIHIGAGRDRDLELRLTAEDIERRGPGLILRKEERGGDRIIVWTD